jgi:hypothetical protein
MCLVVLLGLFMPRTIIVLLWLFTNYLGRAYQSWIVPTLGFFLLPTTTIAYAIAKNALSTSTGGLRASGVVIIVLGVFIDVGLIGSGRGALKRRDDR